MPEGGVTTVEQTQFILIVDVETTGLDPQRDEVVELGALLIRLQWRPQMTARVVNSYVGLREPMARSWSSAFAIHGISPAEVRGQRLHEETVAGLICKADGIIAHNAPFDRAFLVRLFPAARSRPWRCSMHQIPWSRYGHPSRRLGALAADYDLAVSVAHRAETDCMTLYRVLLQQDSRGWPHLHRLVAQPPLLPPEKY